MIWFLIGVVPWVILIWGINDFSWSYLIVIIVASLLYLVIYAGLSILFEKISNKTNEFFKNRSCKRMKTTNKSSHVVNLKDIEEWEKKWNRQHPSRKNHV